MKTIETDGKLTYRKVKLIDKTYHDFDKLFSEDVDQEFLKRIHRLEQPYEYLYNVVYIVYLDLLPIGFFELLDPCHCSDTFNTAYIVKIWIDEKYRGLGYGTQIFDFIYQWYDCMNYLKNLYFICPIDLLVLLEDYGLQLYCLSKVNVYQEIWVSVSTLTSVEIIFQKKQ